MPAQVGSPFAGRLHPATLAMVGCCINTLPMRTSFQGLQTLGELVQEVRETALSAYQNADACLETVMRALGRSPDDPLFSVSPSQACQLGTPIRYWSDVLRG